MYFLPVVVLNALLLKGCFPDKEIEYKFTSPLRNGTYYAVQAGTPPLMNRGHFNNNVKDRYSIDFVKLNRFGRSINGFSPGKTNDYNIYNDTVYSPCDGLVIKVKQDVDCNLSLSKANRTYKADKINNIVIVQTKGAEVILAHLKKGSIGVKEGQEIKVSDYIGLVSNAGAIEPHLHMQLLKNGQATPFLIDGKYLHNNSLLRNEKNLKNRKIK